MKNTKKEFELPVIEIIFIDNDEIITTSVKSFGDYNYDGEEIINF